MTDKEYFEQEYSTWINETSVLGYGHYDNEHFKNIVDMGEKAIPFILEILENEKIDMIAYACDLIYPDEVTYEGYVPLDFCCKIWTQILKEKLNKNEISEQENNS
jgi:hypothetical protein